MEIEGGEGSSGGGGIDPGCLVEQFGSMQTVDQSDLVRQMQRLVSGGGGSGQSQPLSEEYAKFYLEMSNWNVHQAVGNFFDLGGAAAAAAAAQGPRLADISAPTASAAATGPPPCLSMTLVRDTTVGEGESVPPSTHFTKTWSVCNTGPDPWPADTALKFLSGTDLTSRVAVSGSLVSVPALGPGQQTEISLGMRSPDTAGIYESRWRMWSVATGFFGDTIWVIITVEPTGTMALTQQMEGVHFRPSSSETAARPARPHSPTDAGGGDGFVSARNLLERSLNNSTSHALNNDPDEEMN